jgi:hypothetical protein
MIELSFCSVPNFTFVRLFLFSTWTPTHRKCIKLVQDSRPWMMFSSFHCLFCEMYKTVFCNISKQYKTGDLRFHCGMFENSRCAWVIFWTLNTLEDKGTVFLRIIGKKISQWWALTQKSYSFIRYQSAEILANLVGYNSGLKILDRDNYRNVCYCKCAFARCTRPHNKFSSDFNKIFTSDQTRVSYLLRSCFLWLNS